MPTHGVAPGNHPVPWSDPLNGIAARRAEVVPQFGGGGWYYFYAQVPGAAVVAVSHAELSRRAGPAGAPPLRSEPTRKGRPSRETRRPSRGGDQSPGEHAHSELVKTERTPSCNDPESGSTRRKRCAPRGVRDAPRRKQDVARTTQSGWYLLWDAGRCIRPVLRGRSFNKSKQGQGV